jgi:hypothetical protein
LQDLLRFSFLVGSHPQSSSYFIKWQEQFRNTANRCASYKMCCEVIMQ